MRWDALGLSSVFLAFILYVPWKLADWLIPRSMMYSLGMYPDCVGEPITVWFAGVTSIGIVSLILMIVFLSLYAIYAMAIDIIDRNKGKGE